jgi:hypothetical protein
MTRHFSTTNPIALAALVCLVSTLAAGCGQPAAPPKSTASATAQPITNAPRPVVSSPKPSAPPSPPFWNAETAPRAEEEQPRPLLETRRAIDDARVAAAGIRKLSGQRLVLYTDLDSSPEVDRLTELFDQAYPVWCRYFGVSETQQSDWCLTGYLIKDKPRFESVGLLPDNLPPFANGFSRDDEIWLYEQPNDYYRRHLLLHEGTHGFMYTRLRASAPPWYIEGIAELLGTHRLVDGKLQMHYFPQAREEVPLWGRIKLVQDDYAAGRGQFLRQVFDTPLVAHRRVEAYGWCWAAAALLDGHPRYQQRFRSAVQLTTEPDFAEQFLELYREDWQPLSEEWQVFVANLEYGYDLNRMAIEFKPGDALPEGGGKATIAADRGWQSSGFRLQAGQTYRVRGQGRYQVAAKPRVWWSEASGVSIRYYQGYPLGMLLAAMRYDDAQPDEPSGLLRVAAIGLDSTLTPTRSGTLYLRVNDSAAELADNAGSLEVEITPASP